MSICEYCGRNFIYDRKKGHRKTTCNTCLVDIRRKRVTQRCLEYKGGKCSECDYNRSTFSLHFHHLDPAQKDFGISGNWGLSWSRMKQELDKCILVCANCHGEIHEGIRIPKTGCKL